MSDFDPHITVETIESSKDVNCTAKVITLDNHKLKIETPFKILSGKHLTKDSVEVFIDNVPTPLFEIDKIFDWPSTYTTLINLIGDGGSDANWITALNKNIGLNSSIESKYRKNIIISPVFQYYPINDITLRNKPPKYLRMDKAKYEAYLYYVYAASTAFVLTPDIILPPAGRRTFSIEDYLRFIDNSVETLQKYNNKPIFVPVQIDLAINDLHSILGHYKAEGFTNLWINFKAQKCDGSHAGKLSLINETITSFFEGDDVVLYCSHLKQERDATQTEIPAYDMFPPFRGADFIGISRNRRGGGGQDDNLDEKAQKNGFTDYADYLNAVTLRKFSLFDSNSYKYYVPAAYPQKELDENTMQVLNQKLPLCNLFNNIEIQKELGRVREQILETNSLRSYLEAKSGVSQSMDVFEYAMKNTSSPKRKSYQLLLVKK